MIRTYRFYRAGELEGVEVFEMQRSSPERIVCRSRLHRRGVSLMTRLDLRAADGRVEAFRWVKQLPAFHLLLEGREEEPYRLASGITRRTEAGERLEHYERGLTLSPGCLVGPDHSLLHPLHVWLKLFQARSEPSWDLSLFYPSQLSESPALLERKGKLNGGGTLYFLNTGARGFNLWLDADGTPVKASLPFEQVEIVLQGAAIADTVPRPSRMWPGVEETEVRIPAGEVQLAGSLAFPGDGQAPRPAVLLISGRGNLDRDGNPPHMEWNVMRDLACDLAQGGYVTLRYDDRGSGESGGTTENCTLSDLTADARHALRFLRDRPDVDGERVFLLGHSQGALVAMCVGASEPPAGLILMAVPGKGARALLDDQVLSHPAYQSAELAQDVLNFYAFLRSDGPWEEEHIPTPFREYRDRFGLLRELCRLDIPTLARRIDRPLLVLHGGQDAQVGVEHAHVMSNLLPSGLVTLHVHDELDHHFMPAPLKGLGVYNDLCRSIGNGVSEMILDWLQVYAPPGNGT